MATVNMQGREVVLREWRTKILDNFLIGRSARNAIRLLTNHPRKIKGLEAFGIEIVEQVGVGS